MKNLALARIDDRLIHGQVMTQWVRYRSFNTILIVDDAVAKDTFLAQVAIMAVPREFAGKVCSVEDGARYLLEEAGGERILLLVKTPETIEALTESGVAVPELNVGGIGMRPDRKKIYRNIAVSDVEKDVFRRLLNKGMRITVQMVPTDSAIEISKLL